MSASIAGVLITKAEADNICRIINALSSLRVGMVVSGVRRDGVVTISGDTANVDVSLDGITIAGYAPANAATLAKWGTDGDGLPTFNGVTFSPTGTTQDDPSWSASIVFALGGASVRHVHVVGSTTIAVSNIFKAGECKLVLRGDSIDHALTFQSGWVWPESGQAPAILKAGKTMTIGIYSTGSSASGIIATYAGGY